MAVATKGSNKETATDPVWDLAWKIARHAVETGISQYDAVEAFWEEIVALGRDTVFSKIVKPGMAGFVHACMASLRTRTEDRPALGKYPVGSVLAAPFETGHGVQQFGDIDLDDQKFVEDLYRARATGNLKVATLFSASQRMCRKRGRRTPGELPKVDIQELEEMAR